MENQIQNNHNHYDVIVIGSGISGLISSAKLQKHGKKVLLIEQHDKVGGYCTNFKRKGYEFDSSIHFIPGCEPGGILHYILQSCGAENNIEFIKLSKFFKMVYPNRTIDCVLDLDEYKNTLCKEFPHEKENITSFFKGIERIYDALMFTNYAFMLEGYTTKQKIKGIKKHLKGIIEVGKSLKKPYWEYLEDLISDNELKDILSLSWSFLGTNPYELSLLFFSLGFMAYFKDKAYYVKGGSQALSDGIAKAFVDNGGIIKVNTDVKNIIIKNKKAMGVNVFDKKSKKETTYNAKIILSAADVTHTYFDLVGKEHLSEKLIEKIQSMIPGISAFVVYLGVKGEIPPQFKGEHEVFFHETYDLENAYSKMHNCDFKKYVITLYTETDPDLSPLPGEKHIISIFGLTSMESDNLKQKWGITDISKRGEKYKKIKKEIADVLIDKIEKHIPNLRQNIEVMEIATPITFNRYTRNREGAFVGWANNKDQTLLLRLKHKSPIKNLYLASAWTFPGGGVNGAALAGAIVAKTILKRLKKNTEK